jgi:hypothetical protein
MPKNFEILLPDSELKTSYLQTPSCLEHYQSSSPVPTPFLPIQPIETGINGHSKPYDPVSKRSDMD